MLKLNMTTYQCKASYIYNNWPCIHMAMFNFKFYTAITAFLLHLSFRMLWRACVARLTHGQTGHFFLLKRFPLAPKSIRMCYEKICQIPIYTTHSWHWHCMHCLLLQAFSYISPIQSNAPSPPLSVCLPVTASPPPPRPWVQLTNMDRSRPVALFTVMCYNVLCDRYGRATGAGGRLPKEIKLEEIRKT